MLTEARQFALEKHKDQTDRAGVAYFNHVETVALKCLSEYGYIAAIVGYLHDTIEDTSTTREELSEIFGVEVAEAVDVLTKKSGQSQKQYLKLVKENDLARKVKLKDLEHNSDLSRLLEIGLDDLARLKKYQESIKYLQF